MGVYFTLDRHENLLSLGYKVINSPSIIVIPIFSLNGFLNISSKIKKFLGMIDKKKSI